jgi:hypothetical protein
MTERPSNSTSPPPAAQDAAGEHLGWWEDSKRYFLAWFRRVWTVRGGGLYALGFIVSFLYLEITELVLDDIPSFLTLNDYSLGSLIGFAVQWLIDTLKNTLLAFLWPVRLMAWQTPFGVILLLAAFLIFPRYLKGPIERWFLETPDAEAATPDGESGGRGARE